MRRLALLATLSLFPVAGCQDGQLDEVAGSGQEVVICGHGPTVEGIDVSEWQGGIDWSAVAGSGIRFAIVRISDGTYRDRTFATNWDGARGAGLIRGAYQFFEPGGDPIVQADIVVAAVGVLGPGDMPVTCDVEAPSPGVSPAEYTARLHQWVDRVTAGTGRAPIIYTGRYYWDPYVASSDFVGLPLWHAQYTSAACPNIDDRWSDWAFWQYTSSGSIPGIGGNVDRDVWNGTMDELAAFAMSNRAPMGWLDAAGCDGIRGWAQDPDAPSTPIDVHVYIGGPAGDPAAVGFPIHANVHRDDLCSAIGSCEHGFVFAPPLSFLDGADHPVFTYGIDAMGGTNPLLSGAPQTLHCDPPTPPLPPTGAVRRHVPSPDVLAAWHLGFVDVAVLPDATVDAYPDGPDVVATPDLVAVAGDPAVYLLENATLRHVPDPAAMDAWRFDWGAIRSLAPADVAPDLHGADQLARPFLVRGSGPAVYVVDAPPPLWGELVAEDIPGTMPAGSVADVTFHVRNRGSLAWTAGAVALAPTPRDAASALCDPSWPACTRAAAVAGDTATSATGDFQLRVRAPLATGPVHVCFGLVLGTHWFSDPGQNGPADDRMCRTIMVGPPAELSTSDGGVTGGHYDGAIGTMPVGHGHLSGGCNVGGARGPGAMPFLALIGVLALGRRRGLSR